MPQIIPKLDYDLKVVSQPLYFMRRSVAFRYIENNGQKHAQWLTCKIKTQKRKEGTGSKFCEDFFVI